MPETAQSVDELRRASYETWEAITPGWDRHSELIAEVTVPVRDWLIRELAPQPGQTVLELAAGPGDTGFAVAAELGADGRLISTDFSPAMVDLARRRGEERGVDNAEYRVMDAERLELDSDSVDGALCRYGFMLMVDPAAGLAETARVLKPGGRLVLSVWGAPERNPFFSLLAMTLVQAGKMPPPDPEGPGIFAMAGDERTRELLKGAGFAEARLEEVPVTFRVPSIDEYLEFSTDTAGPLAIVLRGLSDHELAATKQALTEHFSGFATDGGYELPGVTLCAVATA